MSDAVMRFALCRLRIVQRIFPLIVPVTALLSDPPAVAAYSPKATARGKAATFVRRTIRSTIRVARIKDPRRRAAATKRLLTRSFSFDLFEGRVLADAAHRFTPEQRRRFSTLFRQLIHRRALLTLIKQAARPQCHDWEIQTVDQLPIGAVVTVDCRATETIPIQLHVARQRGRLGLVDVSISRTLLSRNYRAKINNITRRYGVEELHRRMGRWLEEHEEEVSRPKD